jgi:hypothetical protein
MIFSNKPVIIGITSLLLLTGCLGGRRNDTGNSGNSFRVESISVESISVQKISSLGLPEKKMYNFSACLLDLVMRAPIVQTDFSVSDGSTEIPTRSDVSGCIRWSESHEVDYLQPETLFEVTRTVIGKDTYTGKVSVTFAFNPWSDSEAVLDLRKQQPGQTPEKLKAMAFHANPMTLGNANRGNQPYAFTTNLNLEFLNLDLSNYNIDENLNLTIAHKFRLQFSPGVMRRTLEGKWTLVPLTSGSYELHMLLLRNVQNDKFTHDDVITSLKTMASIRPDGTAITTVSLPIRDMSQVASKMRVLMEVVPKSVQANNIRAGYIVGTMSPLKANSVSVDFDFASQELADSFSSLAQESTVNDTLKPFENFKQHSGMKPLENTPVPRNFTFTPEDFDVAKNLITYMDGKLPASKMNHLLRALCYKTFAYDFKLAEAKEIGSLNRFFNGNPRAETYWKCVGNPMGVINFVSRDIVDRINNPVPKPYGPTRDYSISASNKFEFSNSEETSDGSEFSARGGWSVDGGINLDFLDILGISKKLEGSPLKASLGVGVKASVGNEWYHAVAKNSKSGSGSSSGVSWDQEIKAVSNTFEVDVNFRRCILFGAKAEYQKSMSPKTTDQGFFLCHPTLFTRKAHETYFFVNQSVGSSPFTDPDSPSSTEWRMTFRGNDQFLFFKELVSRKDIVLEFDKIPSSLKPSAIGSGRGLTQSYPGVLSEY